MPTGRWIVRPAASQGSMTLPFTPVDGFIYTLDASFSGVTGDTDWLAMGFAKGQSATSTTNDRFVGGNVIGSTWMLFRGATPAPLATNGNKIQRGLANADPADWLDATLWRSGRRCHRPAHRARHHRRHRCLDRHLVCQAPGRRQLHAGRSDDAGSARGLRTTLRSASRHRTPTRPPAPAAPSRAFR